MSCTTTEGPRISDTQLEEVVTSRAQVHERVDLSAEANSRRNQGNT